MSWEVKRQGEIAGAPVLIAVDGDLTVSLALFVYPRSDRHPKGKRMVRVEFQHADIGKSAAAALALEGAIGVSLDRRHTIRVERTGIPSVIVDVIGPFGIDPVLRYFGDDIANAWKTRKIATLTN